MRRGRIPELGLFLLGYQLFKNIGVTNIPPVTFSAIIIQVTLHNFLPLLGDLPLKIEKLNFNPNSMQW